MPPDRRIILRPTYVRGLGCPRRIIQIDDIDYKVRYSGSDVRLEKFVIIPESVDVLPDTIWNVNVIKDTEASRLYYKITYVSLE